MDSIFLQVACDRRAYPEAAKTVIRLKKIAATWKQQPDDISDAHAYEILSKKTWINLQCLTDPEPLTDISPLADFTGLTGLCLWKNRIKSLSALKSLVNLRYLGISDNLIEDVSVVGNLKALKELELRANPVNDLSVLAALPELEKLEISSDQFPAISSINALPKLRTLRVHETSANLKQLPNLPSLRELHTDTCESLEGIERFAELRNIVIGSGELRDLSPLQGLKNLTHLNIGHNQVTDLEPLKELYALRDLWAGKNQISSIETLLRLPMLHAAVVKENPLSKQQVAALESHLTPWDEEFADKEGRHEPFLSLETVDQKTWEFYDKNPFGLLDSDDNQSMFDSEKSWIINRIKNALAVDWKKEADFDIPWQTPHARSHSVVLLSDEAASSLRQVASVIQRELCSAKNEFIIYLQTDIDVDESLDFTVWVYRDKIMVTHESAPLIEKLLCS